MAHGKMEMGLVLVLVTMLWAGATAQSSCTNVIISMSPCLNYITGNSSTPSSSCCSQLASVVRSQPQCLCQVLNGGGSSLGININQTRALALPAASPAASPAGSTKSSNTTPSGTGSKTVPSTEGSSSAGNSIKLSISHLFFLICAATVATAFTTY
ncbi:non-specific lipid-transfer protein-like protein [Quercus suber]|uniref:Non-specific lipid-transfer protein-like protein n=1 Tax=Quercus suber TaxID=58331 RepID=A0AAW0J6Z7_QUESU